MVTRKNNFYVLFVVITVVSVIVDQLLKLMVSIFSLDWNLSFLRIHLVKNTGAGFGILQNQPFLLMLISLVVALVIIFSYKKIPKEKIPQILFALFLGGVVGNLIDRVFRQYVVDFIDFSFWPAFNVADALISVSVIGLVVWFWKK